MQTEAIIEAAITVTEAHKDWRFVPEIMVPLITDLKELNYIKGIIVACCRGCSQGSRQRPEVHDRHHGGNSPCCSAG